MLYFRQQQYNNEMSSAVGYSDLVYHMFYNFLSISFGWFMVSFWSPSGIYHYPIVLYRLPKISFCDLS